MGDEPEQIVLVRIEHAGRWYRLVFSNGFEIRATRKVIEMHELKEGLALSPEAFEQLQKILERAYAFLCAESLLAQHPYSTRLFRERLRRKDIADELIADVTAAFKANGLLDDHQYALGCLRSLMLRKPAGKPFLVAYLQQRGVPRPIAEKAVAEALAETDETAIAVRLLEKRRTALANFDLETARRKAYTYLSRRSISYAAARKAFEQLFGKQ